MKNFSYKDISQLTGFSISTISRYYNGGYVAKNTRKVIDAIVKKYNYYPNRGARLIRGYDNSIFIIAPQWHDNSFTQVVNGIQLSTKKYKDKVIITCAESDYDNYIDTIKYVTSWRPKSIVFLLPPVTEKDPEIQNKIVEFINNNVVSSGLLFYGTKIEGHNSIVIDFESAFYALTKKFISYIEKGQKVIFVIDNKLSSAQREERKAGFIKACKDSGIEKFEIVILANRDSKQVSKFLNYLNSENLVNVVCSTHEVFINLISSGDKNLRLTDISYQSIYDSQSRYKCKIFIDYPKIGLHIANILNNYKTDKKIENKVFQTQIIFK